MKPELLANLLIRNHPAMPLPVSAAQPEFYYDIDECCRICAVGIGTLGAEMVQILSRNLPGITCHEIIHNSKGESLEQMATLLSLVRESDLLFILTGFDDEHCGAVARAVGHPAREAGVLTFAVIPDESGISPQSLAQLAEVVDTVFAVSARSLTGEKEPFPIKKATLTGYSMRHMVTTITTMLHQRSFICVDFTDIVTMMREGSSGRLGVGVASGPDKGGIAAKQALERLSAQRISTFDATGVLAIVQGSSLLTMDDYDDVSRVIHDHVTSEVNVLVGFVTDDQLGYNVKVSVFPVQ